MKALIQRVAKASVSVDNDVISSIGQGICVLVGISDQDTKKDSEYLVRKILNLRIFDDENGKRWNKNVMDKGFEILSVSQFTLMSVLKGNKPDFHKAMPPERSEEFYNDFLSQMKAAYDPSKIQDGKFGATMQVNIVNDGPVTILLSSANDKE